MSIEWVCAANLRLFFCIRPHRLLMVRWLNLRSFHGDKQPTQRLAELRVALGDVALLIGALQIFLAEVHTAARNRKPAGAPPVSRQ